MALNDWIKDIPIVTRTYVVGSLLTTAVCAVDLVSPYSLYFSFKLVTEKLQFWRIFTTFFFFGSRFSLDLLFHMFFLARYCRALEEGSFRGRTADFMFMIFLGAIVLLCLSPLFQLPFLGQPLILMMVYVWSRRNPYARMSFLGLFTFTAPYLPWLLLSFSALLGHEGITDIVGIAIGHIYYFLEDVFPRMIPSRRRLLKTPAFFAHRFHDERPVRFRDVVPDVVAEADNNADDPAQQEEGEQLLH